MSIFLQMRPQFRRRPEHDPSSPNGGRRERGASLVEYALLVALLAVPTVGAIEYVQGGAETKVDQTAEGISTHTIPSIPPSSDGGGGGGGGPTSSSTPPTPTTAAPTPTTAAPTPTTAAPTATTSRSAWGSLSRTNTDNNTRWTSSGSVTITDDLGQTVANAKVMIRVEYRTSTSAGWSRISTLVEATTNASGVATFTSPKFRRSSGSSPPYALQLQFVITSVTKSGLTWNGSNATSSTVTRPN